MDDYKNILDSARNHILHGPLHDPVSNNKMMESLGKMRELQNEQLKLVLQKSELELEKSKLKLEECAMRVAHAKEIYEKEIDKQKQLAELKDAFGKNQGKKNKRSK